MFGHGVVRAATLQTLEVLGIGVTLMAFCTAGALIAKWGAEPLDAKVIDSMPPESCRIYGRVKGFEVVYVISSGDCVEAMAATRRILETKVLRDEKPGE